MIRFLKGSHLIEQAILYKYTPKLPGNSFHFFFLIQIVLTLLFPSYYQMYLYFSNSLIGIDTC